MTSDFGHVESLRELRQLLAIVEDPDIPDYKRNWGWLLDWGKGINTDIYPADRVIQLFGDSSHWQEGWEE